MATENPSLAEVIRNIAKDEISGVNTCIPATVESYDATKNRCSVIPDLKFKTFEGKDMDRPEVFDVPIMTLGNKKTKFTFQLEKGDSVLLLVSQRAISKWKKSSERPIDVGSVNRKYDMNDAIAIPTVWGAQHSSSANLVIRSNGIVDVRGKAITFNGVDLISLIIDTLGSPGQMVDSMAKPVVIANQAEWITGKTQYIANKNNP